ncbi:uncharacterized protein LOC124628632 [Ictalurus punctatus]|uniref:Gypsy retrotransposon integrase-like protein 1 n=1 Tax=Ictalurus punctatus TaxID=7998 RepID=A0A9F7TJI9_ICTPU|nr:uncharacterized protein LOC124628632 [Ictalurus punctatus]
MDPTLQHLLETSLQQHAVTQQLAESLQVATQTLIAMRTETPAASTPLPDATSEIRRLLPPLGPEEDLEAYFETFESIACREGWDRDDWPRALGPLLTGEARTAYYALDPEEATDYLAMKEGVLAWCGRTPGRAATEFHRWVYRTGARPRCQMNTLLRITKRWLRPDRHTASEVAEKVAVDRFLRALPRAERQAVGAHAPTTPQELLTALERTLATLELDSGEQQHLDRPLGAQGPRSDCQTRPRIWRNPQRAPTCEHPRDEPMPTEPEREAARLLTKPWLAGCALHQQQLPEAPSVTVWVEGRPVTALLDTGSTVTLAQPSILPEGRRPSGTLTVTCVHGDTREVPSAEVQIRSEASTWPLQVGIIPELPVPLLLGRDWPGFRVVPRAESWRPRRRGKGIPTRPAYLAQDDGEATSEGKTPQTTNPLSSVFPQVNREGKFGREQKEDDRLKHCWAQVRVIEGVDQSPDLRLPTSYFLVRGGLLYQRACRRGEQVDLLVVPRAKTAILLHLAHTHPLGGHLGARNTLEKLRDRFVWPGMDAEVRTFCQQCPQCQRTAPRRPPPAPLIPLPIIGVPFERVGMDLVGPLPKSARGHEYILVLVDYATRYPEAVPLRKATSQNIARELVLLFSRVGIPKDVLTDQGTPFVSKLMADLCRMLQVKHLRTSVYHPQTDGLVERFNQTLKRMLRRVVDEEGRNWDLLLPYVLFAVRECPQASTGFTPFELLFGRRPRGLLDVAREAWEEQPSPFRSVVEYVQDMQARIDRVGPIVREHMLAAQEEQKKVYNRPAQPREFQPGDRVLLLVPSSACKFLARWQGPYTVLERRGPVNYRLQQPGKPKDGKLYHINLLKKWVEPTPVVSAFAVQDSDRGKGTLVGFGEDLTPTQRQELTELTDQFADVFSAAPGMTQLVQHEIKTPPGVVVRQRPYRVPEARRQAIEEEISRMLRDHIIEESSSPWSSPIVVVPKPDGSMRLCNDFRRLNQVSEFDSYPLPRVDDLIERLGRARFISTLDLTKGYWQVALAPEARPKTAFSTATGHWQYRVLPFGLHGAPATFQRLMDILLRPHRQFAAAYLDDVVIHSSTWADHLFHLREILKALREAGLTANPKKCHLGLTEAQYLGYRIGRGMLKPQQKKIEAVKDYPRPTSKKQVRAFLGLAGYYRRFVPNFSAVASPLSDLTKKGQPDQVRWTADAERAFQALKEALTSAPILRNPDFDLPFTVHTDASETGLGAVLSQTFDGEEHPVLYISRKLSPAERKYAAVEREALAIKWAIEELRYYLAGRHFILITDHAPLQWMAKAKDTNARVTRWFLALQDFSFQVKHRAGAQHGNADGLSRRDALWAHHRAAVGSELRGGYCRDGQRSGAHQRENAPSPTAAPARRGQLPAEHSASWRDRRGRAGLTRLRPAIGGSNGEVPPLRRRRRRIKERASGREGEENIVASKRTPSRKRGRDRRIVRVAHTEDAGPGKPPPRLGNPASATSRLRRPSRLHKPPHSSIYHTFTSP